MATLAVEPEVFWARLVRLRDEWVRHRETEPLWHKADAISVATGARRDDDAGYTKQAALQQHLFGAELNNVVFVLCQGACHVLCGANKLKLLEPLKGAAPADAKLKLLLYQTSSDGNDDAYAAMCAAILASFDGARVARLLKEDCSGGVADGWHAALERKDLEAVEASTGLGSVLAVKDEPALALVRKAAILTNKVFKHGLVRPMEDAFDQEKYPTHEALAKGASAIFADPSKIQLKAPRELIEECYFPIVQSGGAYELKASAETDARTLRDDVVILQCGGRY